MRFTATRKPRDIARHEVMEQLMAWYRGVTDTDPTLQEWENQLHETADWQGNTVIWFEPAPKTTENLCLRERVVGDMWVCEIVPKAKAISSVGQK